MSGAKRWTRADGEAMWALSLPVDLVERMIGVHGDGDPGTATSKSARDMAQALLEQLPEDWPLDQPHQELGLEGGRRVMEAYVQGVTWCQDEHHEQDHDGGDRFWRCTLDLGHGGDRHQWDPARVGLPIERYAVKGWPVQHTTESDARQLAAGMPDLADLTVVDPPEQEQETPQQETRPDFGAWARVVRERLAAGMERVLDPGPFGVPTGWDGPAPSAGTHTWAPIGFPHHMAEPDVDYGPPGPLLGPLAHFTIAPDGQTRIHRPRRGQPDWTPEERDRLKAALTEPRVRGDLATVPRVAGWRLHWRARS